MSLEDVGEGVLLVGVDDPYPPSPTLEEGVSCVVHGEGVDDREVLRLVDRDAVVGAHRHISPTNRQQDFNHLIEIDLHMPSMSIIESEVLLCVIQHQKAVVRC